MKVFWGSILLVVLGVQLGFAQQQLRVGDPGVRFDTKIVQANLAQYPQIEKWVTAGVRGGIPPLESIEIKATVTGSSETEINAAIREVSGMGGGGVLLKNGNYTISSRVDMATGVSLIGESRDGVKCSIKMTSGGAFLFDGVEKCGIYRMHIEGSWGQPKYDWNYGFELNREMPDNENISIRIVRSTDCWVDGVNIINSAQDPLRCAANHITMRDLKVDGAHNKAGGAEGYFFIQGGYNLITECQITRLRHISLQGDAVEYNVVYGNDFRQEVSFHSGDAGNNLIANNRITLPEDMPPFKRPPYDEMENNGPNYFAIMGPWSDQHTVSANPNFLINNQCQQDNHRYGSSTPWSKPGVVYKGPLKIGKTPDDHEKNFPALSSRESPQGGRLYPVLLTIEETPVDMANRLIQQGKSPDFMSTLNFLKANPASEWATDAKYTALKTHCETIAQSYLDKKKQSGSPLQGAALNSFSAATEGLDLNF